MDKYYFCATHLVDGLDTEKRKQSFQKIIKLIKKSKIKFTHIAISGISGALFGIPIAIKLNKELIVVRKRGKTHSKRKVETIIPKIYKNINYIIIDDLIDSGKTIKRIIKEIQLEFINAKCKGIFLNDEYCTGNNKDNFDCDGKIIKVWSAN